MKFYLIIFLSGLIYNICFAQGHVKSEVSEKVQRAWVKKTTKEMRGADLDNVQIIEAHIIDLDQFYQISYRLQGIGKLVFNDGSWIYLVAHSSHDNKQIGDIILAMDSNKKFYQNIGHICGGIVSFKCNQKLELLNSRVFFDSFVTDVDDSVWTKR